MSEVVASYDEGQVVNVDHLLAYVTEMREAGAKLVKDAEYKDALTVYQQGIDAIAQTEELPMHRDDVVLVVQARSTLHSNRAQIFLLQELYRRAIEECDEAVEIDVNNAKGLYRRATAHEKVKEWHKALADVKAMQDKDMLNRNKEFLNPDSLQEWQAKLEQQCAEYDLDFDDRMEDAGARNLKELREQFEEVVKNNKLKGNDEIAAEMAEMIERDGGRVTAEKLAAVYQLDEDDADVMLRWLEKSIEIHKVLGEGGARDALGM